MKKIIYAPIFLLVAWMLICCTSAKKLKFSSMYITKQALTSISGEKELKSIFFRANDNLRFISKDKVGLTAHTNYGKTLSMKAIELSSLPKEEKFPSDKIFTSYYFTSGKLKEFLDDNADTKIIYFIIKPILAPNNNNYITYQLIPADINFVPVTTALMAKTVVMDPSPPAPAP